MTLQTNLQQNNNSRVHVHKTEFYITNVCNLACTNCNRFNNYDFAGWQKWDDYADIYAEWAKKINIKDLVILGGEPLLNPSICNWIKGLNKLWNKGLQIVTNGTRLNSVPGLYDSLVYHGYSTGNWVIVSIHNVNDIDRYLEEIHTFLQPPIKILTGADAFGADYAFQDRNRLRIHAWIQDSFYNAAIQQNQLGRLSLHDSDPIQAHSECGMAKYKNYHFIKGKLYKCGPVALMSEFDKQHQLDITDSDRALLNGYIPLSVTEFDELGKDFLTHIDDVIPQCKFCPTSLSNTKLFALNKKNNSTSSFKITHK